MVGFAIVTCIRILSHMKLFPLLHLLFHAFLIFPQNIIIQGESRFIEKFSASSLCLRDHLELAQFMWARLFHGLPIPVRVNEVNSKIYLSRKSRNLSSIRIGWMIEIGNYCHDPFTDRCLASEYNYNNPAFKEETGFREILCPTRTQGGLRKKLWNLFLCQSRGPSAVVGWCPWQKYN